MSGTNGRRSARRFDLERRIKIARLPARFCSCDPLIHGHEDLEAGTLREAKQSAVLLTGEARFWHGAAVMVRQAVLELSGNALVEENDHPSWPTRRDLASSNAEMAASRLTVGKSSTNS